MRSRQAIVFTVAGIAAAVAAGGVYFSLQPRARPAVSGIQISNAEKREVSEAAKRVRTVMVRPTEEASRPHNGILPPGSASVAIPAEPAGPKPLPLNAVSGSSGTNPEIPKTPSGSLIFDVPANPDVVVLPLPRSYGSIRTTPVAAVVPKPDQAADEDIACREKLRSRGILLVAGNPCVDLDLVVKNLVTGTYKYNKPDSAYVDEAFLVVLTLVTSEDQDVTSEFAGTAGAIISKQAKFAQHVEAVLHGGQDFKVEPAEPQQRTVTSLAPVVWQWTVTPLRSGTKKIVIDVSANLVLGTQKEHVQIKTLDEPIEIRVGVMHLIMASFANIWGFLIGLATMAIAVLGIIHYVRSLRHKDQHHSESDEPPPIELVTHQQEHSGPSASHSA